MAKYFRSLRCAVICTLLSIWCIATLIHQQIANDNSNGFDTKTSEKIELFNHRNTRRNRNIASYHDSSNDYFFKEDEIKPKQTAKNSSSLSNRLMKFVKSDFTDDTDKNITLNDVYISVKTTGKYHKSRLQVVIDTWFAQAQEQTYFFTDVDDPEFAKKTNGHLINTNCKSSHMRNDLSCKLGAEYDGYLYSNKKWWCHFDDDNYVNIKQLVTMLRRHKWTDDVYIGRPSLDHPFYVIYRGKRKEFWFATGGAGVCISRALAEKMKPWCGNGELAKTSDALKVPDDCTLGFVIYNRLGVELTRYNRLHSHLEYLPDLDRRTFKDQVTLSYRLGNGSDNVINLPTRFDDSTRLKDLHCILYPDTSYCR